jgi:hypothetical protein
MPWGIAMGNVPDLPVSDNETTSGQPGLVRRRWHAPQFMLTGVAETEVENNTPSDHNNGQGPS